MRMRTVTVLFWSCSGLKRWTRAFYLLWMVSNEASSNFCYIIFHGNRNRSYKLAWARITWKKGQTPDKLYQQCKILTLLWHVNFSPLWLYYPLHWSRRRFYIVQVKKIAQQEKYRNKIDSPSVWARPKWQDDCPFKIAFCLTKLKQKASLVLWAPNNWASSARPNHSRTESPSHANS